jgi:TP901 family phage tail tape measure protein
MSNEASFHARITADAKQFVAEMQGAAAALATLVKQAESAGKVSTSGAKNEGAKAAREIQDVYGTARKEADKLHNQTMQDISAENAERRKAMSGRSGSGDFFQPQGKRSAALGPVREGSIGALDQLGLQQVLKSTYQVTEAERKRAEMNKQHMQAIREDRARMNKLHLQGLKDNHAYDAAIARAAANALKAQQRQMDAMVTGRYALYDLSSTYDMVGMKALQFLGVMTQILTVAGKFETSFTSVERAMQPVGDEFEKIKSQLIGLTQTMPLAFGDITKIATLGAQMGVTANGIESFTENVASFSAITGASIDETAQRFGRIAGLADIASTDFNKLGSAVAFTGINAVATEQEILALTESIAAATKGAGFAADEIVGFATTLSSLGIAPEQARGVVLRVFADINRAVDTGGKKLQAFGDAAGLSAESAAALWKADPQAYFRKLLTGLGTVSNFTDAMDRLGFTETRETNVLQRLSQNMDIYTKSMDDANKSYEEGTFLAEAYGKTADNLEARFTMLANSIQLMADAAGHAMVGPLGELFRFLTSAVKNITAFMKTPVGQFVAPLTAGLTALVAIIALFTGAMYKSTAQLFAMRTAMIQMGRTGQVMSGNFSALISTMLGFNQAVKMTDGSIEFMTKKQALAAEKAGTLTNAVGQFERSSKTATIAARGLGIAMGAITVVGIVTTLATIVGSLIETHKAARDLTNGTTGLREALAGDYASALKTLGSEAAVSSAIASGAIQGVTKDAESNTEAVKAAAQAAEDMGTINGTNVPEGIGKASDAIKKQNIVLGDNYDAWVQSAIASSDSFKEAAKNEKFIQFLKDTGYSFKEANDAAKKGKVAADEYFNSLIDNARKSGKYTQMFDARNIFGGLFGTSKTIASIIPDLNLLKDGIVGSANTSVALGFGVEDASDKLRDFGSDADATAGSMENLSKSVRTVVDYAGDLGGVFDRIGEIKFGRQQALDEIASGWEKVSNKAKDAADAIEEVKQTQLELDAKKELLKYQLAVAERYGDEKRAVQIKAKLAKVEKDLAKESEKLKEAQQEANKSTTDGTQAARDNKDALFGMVGSYQGLIEMYAKTGLKGDALKKKIAELAGEFKTSGLAAGFLESDLKPYVDSFTDFADAADKLPRDVTVEFNLKISAAQQALNEFVAKLDKVDGTTKTTTVVSSYKSVFDLSGLSVQRLLDKISGLQANIEIAKLKLSDPGLSRANRIGFGQGATSAAAEIQRIHDQILRLTGGRNPVYAQGGYVSGPGSSTSDSINARLSNGEFVMRASAVSAYGLDFMNAINQQRSGGVMPKAPAVSSSAGGSQVVYLSPDDRALLRAALDRPIALYTDNQKIAQSANAGNVVLAQRGSN